MTLDDRFTKGLIAGICGGFISLSWGLTSKFILHFTTLLYADFAAALVYGRKAHDILEIAFSLLVVFMFFGAGGIAFAYLIRHIGSQNIILKGLFWGSAIWFASYVMSILYKVPELQHIPLKTSVSQLIGGFIWGSTMAWAYNYLDQKTSKV